MPSATDQLPLKTKAMTTATCTNCTAVALSEPSAEVVSFRWHQPSLPPTQNVNSADCSRVPA
ncbi:MAG: hypothetical protein H0X30_31020 [Anaerolineae bacterium]|nr:hypothetical protein [Anaerolineae bacterium]